MVRIAFIGLGAMGFPMAGHLAQAGHDVRVYNRTPEKARHWVSRHGGFQAMTPAEAAADTDAVFTCVGADADLAAVIEGVDGAFAGMKPGALLVDHTTVSANIARRLAKTGAELGFLVVDAPVSGGQTGAENGQLAIMCGGAEAACEKARPLMTAYASRIVRIGEAGSGQLAKMVNQIAIAGLVQGLAEAVHFIKCAGLPAETVIEAISGGAAQSWQMNNRALTMAAGEFDFGFAVEWMRKDLGLALDEARSNGARLPVTALVDQFYADLQAMGAARQDTSSLIRRLEE